MVELAAELIATGAWQGIGVRSVEHWLVWQAGVSPHRARQITAIARRRSELPVTCDTLTRGELSVDQVTEVARFVPAHNDAEAASFAKAATVPQLRNTLSRYRFANDTAEPHAEPTAEPAPADDSDAVRKGTATTFLGGDRFGLRVDAPLDDGALIEKALAEAKDALFQQGRPDVTIMDALLEVCTRSLSTVDSAGRASRFRVYLHLDTDGWLNQGPALPSALTEKIVCDGVLQPVWETEGAPVNVGRTQRIVPDRTRRLVLDRDRGCVVPGCGARHHLEVHHVVAWLHGGRTDTVNLVCLCPFHHDALHRGELSISGDAYRSETLEFTDGLGRTMPSGPTPVQPTGSAERAGPDVPPKPPRYRHPLGERMDTRCVYFSPPSLARSSPGRPHAPPT